MDAVAPLAAALGDEEPLVRSRAAKALGRLGGAVSAAALEARLGIELDPSVVAELRAALGWAACASLRLRAPASVVLQPTARTDQRQRVQLGTATLAVRA